MEIFVKGPYPTMLLGFYQDLCPLMISIIVGSAVSDYKNNLENLRKILPYFVAFAGLALSFVGLVFWTFFVPDPVIWICHLDDWESCYEDKGVVEEILMILALFVIMVFHILLCYGFIKKRPNFVIPWMVLNVIFFAYFLKQVSNFNLASLADFLIKTKHSVFPKKLCYKNSSFWHINSCFVLQTTKTQVFVLIIEII